MYKGFQPTGRGRTYFDETVFDDLVECFQPTGRGRTPQASPRGAQGGRVFSLPVEVGLFVLFVTDYRLRLFSAYR